MSVRKTGTKTNPISERDPDSVLKIMLTKVKDSDQ